MHEWIPIVAAVLVLLSVAALSLAGLACSALLGFFKEMFARSRRRAYELPADWWTRFEHDLRAYQSERWASARDDERRG